MYIDCIQIMLWDWYIFFFSTHHSSNIAETLEVLYNTTLVGWFNTGKAAWGVASLALQVGWQLVKLSPRQPSTKGCTLCLLFLLLCDDPNTTADWQRCAFIVTYKSQRNKQLEVRNFKTFKILILCSCIFVTSWCAFACILDVIQQFKTHKILLSGTISHGCLSVCSRLICL